MQVMIDLPEVTLQEVRWHGLYLCPRDRYTLEDAIKNAVPVEHGLWHDSDFVPGLLSCSICGAQHNPNFKIGGGAWYYCPNCGAKMDRKEKET